MKTIRVSEGYKEYAPGWLVDETGEDISGATFQLAPGTSAKIPPATGWVSPDVSSLGTASITTIEGVVVPVTAQRILKLLIDVPTLDGAEFSIWLKLTDNPEIIPICFPGRYKTA
jgi:hypothetical protein